MENFDMLLDFSKLYLFSNSGQMGRDRQSIPKSHATSDVQIQTPNLVLMPPLYKP